MVGASAILDSPAAPAALAGAGGVAFVVARLLLVAHGDVTRLVFAGSKFFDRPRAPGGVHIFAGTGYDGEFYYRLALNPVDLVHTAYGITLDSVFRVQRIGFSALSWLGAGGRWALVPWTLVVVNLLALVSVGWLGGVFARESGRHALWGLMFAGYWGFLFSIGRDLPEVVASAFLLAGLLSLRRRQPFVAGLLLGGAVLSLETTLDVVIAVVAVSIGQIVLRRRLPGRQDLAWIAPCVIFATWQLIAWAETGALPFRAGAGDNLAVPFVNAVGALGHYVARLPSMGAVIWLSEFAALAAVVVFAAACLARSTLPSWERLAWAISLLVTLSLSSGLWYGRADFRAYEDLYLLSILLVVGSRRRLWLPALLVSMLWVTTFAHRAVKL